MVRCRVCNSKGKRYLFKKYGFDIVKCHVCGLVYTDFKPTTRFLKDYYSKSYFVDGNKKLGYDDYAKEEISSRLTAKKRISSLKLKPKGVVLDVGCAYGYFLSEMPDNWKKYGLEISQFAYSKAVKTNPDANIKNQILTKSSFIDQKFDLITLWDVIEHLDDPKEVISTIYQKLKKGGRLIMSTGDIGSLFAKLQGKDWHLLNPPQHLSFFSTKTISTLLESIGFSQIKITHPSAYYPISYLVHKLESMYGQSIPIPKTISQKNIPVNLWDIMEIQATK